MTRESNVLLIEDDFYANNWMEMLLRRDWRTRVVGEARSPFELPALLKELSRHRIQISLALIDTDIPQQSAWLPEVLNHLARIEPRPAVLFTGVTPNHMVADLWPANRYRGYILKSEIRYSLAWAVALAVEGRFVITPGVYPLFRDILAGPNRVTILDGRNPIAELTPREAEIACMAFIFSMERKDLADEMGISEGQINNQISALYTKIGLKDIFGGEADPAGYYGTHPAVKAHLELAFAEFRQAVDKSKQKCQPENGERKKMRLIKNQETLAFHLLTLPYIQEINA